MNSTTRYRSRDTRTTESFAYKCRFWDAGGSDIEPHEDVDDVPGAGVVENMVDVVTERFHTLSAQGEIVNNSLQHSKEEFVPQSKTVHITCEREINDAWLGFFTVEYSGDIWRLLHLKYGSVLTMQADPPKPSLAQETAAQEWSVVKAHASLGQGDFDVPHQLGEFAETLRALTRLYQVFRTIRGKPSRGVRKLTMRELRDDFGISPARLILGQVGSAGKFLGNTYLAYKFGVKPAVQQYEGLKDLLNSDFDVPPRLTARGYARTPTVSSSSQYEVLRGVHPYWATADCPLQLHVKCTTHAHTEFRSGILYSMDRAYALLHKLGIDNLPEAAWELTPFTFMTDWFHDVGSIIRAFTPEIGVETLTDWLVTSRIVDHEFALEYRLNSDYDSYPLRFRGLPGAYVIHKVQTEKSRARIPELRMPRFKRPHLSLDKLLTIGIIASR